MVMKLPKKLDERSAGMTGISHTVNEIIDYLASKEETEETCDCPKYAIYKGKAKKMYNCEHDEESIVGEKEDSKDFAKKCPYRIPDCPIDYPAPQAQEKECQHNNVTTTNNEGFAICYDCEEVVPGNTPEEKVSFCTHKGYDTVSPCDSSCPIKKEPVSERNEDKKCTCEHDEMPDGTVYASWVKGNCPKHPDEPPKFEPKKWSERNALIDELIKDSYKLKVAVGDNPDVSNQYTLDVSNTYHSNCGFNRAVDEFIDLLTSKKK